MSNSLKRKYEQFINPNNITDSCYIDNRSTYIILEIQKLTILIQELSKRIEEIERITGIQRITDESRILYM